jgi:ABC-type phosphate/phosphonate transport system substrate-binding protein
VSLLKRIIATGSAVLLCLVSALTAPASGAGPATFHVNIGFSSKAFVNIPREDIRVAVRILSQKVAKKTVGSADTRIYNSLAEIERDLRAKKLDAVALTPEDFLEMSPRTPIEPVMVTSTDKGPEVELVLLTRKDSGISTVRGLNDRTIAVPARIVQYGNMYFTWLETLLMREGVYDKGTFFSRVKETKNPSLSLMQVFFHQADACIVTSQVFELASELNPQISKELKIIARVDKLTGGIIVIRADLQADLKQKLIQALRTMHEDQEGRQLFLLFQLSGLVPYRPEYLRATEAFFTEHRTLKRRTSRMH